MTKPHITPEQFTALINLIAANNGGKECHVMLATVEVSGGKPQLMTTLDPVNNFKLLEFLVEKDAETEVEEYARKDV